MELNNIEKSKKLLHLDGITIWRGFVIPVWLNFLVILCIFCPFITWSFVLGFFNFCNDCCHKLDWLKVGGKGLRFACKKTVTAWYCLESTRQQFQSHCSLWFYSYQLGLQAQQRSYVEMCYQNPWNLFFESSRWSDDGLGGAYCLVRNGWLTCFLFLRCPSSGIYSNKEFRGWGFYFQSARWTWFPNTYIIYK